MRTGAQYLESLKDGREVVIAGEIVADVTTHPAFSGICKTIATLYDLVGASPDMTFPSPSSGLAVQVSHLIPRSIEDLKRRRIGLTRFAQHSFGHVGRGPEHVASFFAGFASTPEFFGLPDRSDGSYARNVVRFHEKIREEHLYVTYTIIPPQIDRSRSANEQEEAYLPAGVYREQDDGIVIRGAQMLGTATAISDYLFLSCIQPLRPGDEPYAISVVLPVASPGLRLYARRGYAVGQPSVFDYPLSTRFDESDALAVFRDVFVPWEHVFVYKDIERTRAQWHETPAHILGNTQAQIRLTTKAKFLLGIARKIAATNKIDSIPSVQWQLGELAALVAVVEGMVLAAEAEAVSRSNGVIHPHPRFLYGAMGLQSRIYPQMIAILRELAGGGLLQVPSSVKEYENPDTVEDIRRYIRSSGVKSEDRVKLFKLAWELVGSEFAGRHQQYEMFYAGAPFVPKTYSYNNYGFEEALELVDRCLESYDLQTENP